MKLTQLLLIALLSLAACGPTAEEQHAMDQQKCSGYGFQPGTDAYAHCMMNVSLQRQSEQAADQRAATDRWAADQRANAALAAAKNAPDQSSSNANINSSSIDTSPTTGMQCTSSTVTSGTPFNQSSRSVTNCHN
jgi:hypothetical protein